VTGVTDVDVVVVSYNSREHLRACLEPLAGHSRVRAIAVDNASTDGSLETIADLDVHAIALGDNRGFAHGCNVGWYAGSSPYVLFLNPDAQAGWEAIERLLGVMTRDDAVGAVAPRIVCGDGALDYSQRRFPRLRSTYAQALFLHRLFPSASWTDEVVRTAEAYALAGEADWVSGACILVRRTVLEELSGLDEGFFMYCEDIDLCRRIWDAGFTVRFEPSAVVGHEGGKSMPRARLLPVLAASRLRYASKHRGPVGARVERAGIALGALTHVLVARGGVEMRKGHAGALLAAARS
jgi:N-acetylglucosaminyl-diphospho-decaprenol L-rhamnosyltransferase